LSVVRRLPEDIVRGIAAGEVVERPASVLKELLENAVDAGARRIEVEWRDAGRGRLRVTDDGSGMSPEDARLALERHATSKIRDLADLERLATYGFRGEALPSIAAVSRFSLLTRRAADPEGWSITVEAGRAMREGPAAAPAGTTIIAADIFFAVPARLKFLKADATERSLLLRTLEDAALAEPAVGFRVLDDGRDPLTLPPFAPDDAEGLRERLGALWGEARVLEMKRVDAPGRPLRVSGWISDINAPQATGRYQRFFVNRRPVASRRLTHALYDAYRGCLATGRHPACAAFLDIDPSLVDVNVHPTKREVRLSNEEQIHDFFRRALRDALARSAQAPVVFALGAAEEASVSGAATGTYTPRGGISIGESRTAFHLQRPQEFGPTPEAPDPGPLPGASFPEGLSRDVFRSASFEPLEQLYGTYLLTRLNSQFFIFDQHAAAERALYERLVEDAKVNARQGLLLPWLWEMSPETAAVVTETRDHFAQLGFNLEPFGGSSFRVKAVPAALGESPHVRPLLEGLASDLLSGRVPRGLDPLRVRAACRGSVMAGHALARPEMSRLISDLQRCESPWTCPHGRPTFLRLADEDLAKRFRRV